MATHYYNLPIEDFRFDFTKDNTDGFNIGRCDGGKTNMMSGPEAVHSEWGLHRRDEQISELGYTL